ncbi:MAG TPA: hypothetical protein VHZ25_03560 [Acidobacteriaceae bacterium]|nr:hypothetical protein [Acidobacteriaceae bacterium]
MTNQEFEAIQKAENDARPVNQWLAARAQFAPPLPQKDQTAPFPTDSAGNIVFDPDYLNCPDPAFRNAVLTLHSRAGTWGAKSATLEEWIHGQDAVFANCAATTATIPQSAPAGSPALLRADREYQVAAADLYAKQYDAAQKAFETIALDKNSPWHKWGTYLAARSLVRKALAMGKPTEPYSGDLATFDMATMRQAQEMLEDLLRARDTEPSRKAIVLELNFVRLRTEPQKRVEEICTALAGPGSDENFNQDLEDLSFALSKGIRIDDSAGLWAWIDSWRTKDVPDAGVAVWQQNHQLPWLVLALAKVSPTNPAVPQLLAAAEKIQPGTPGWDSVFFRRVRLLIALQRNDEARALLDAQLPAALREQPSSNANALLGERLSVARNFDEFLQYAPRIVLTQGSEGADDLMEVCMETARRNHLPERCNNADDHPPGFDEDSVQVFNREMPLTRLVDAARSPQIPARLRQDITVATWVRAVALKDAATAEKLARLLPDDLRKTAGTGTGFDADLTILRNPGMRPYLEPGVSRLQSYSLFDNFGNNWWSKEWDTNDIDRRTEKQPEDDAAIRAAAILTKEEVARGEAQYKQLLEDGSGAVLIGQRVVDYAKAHSDDPAVPEALALTVRATHYSIWGGEYPKAAADNTAVSKAAFQLLHSRYPKSPWTAKTPFYY